MIRILFLLTLFLFSCYTQAATVINDYFVFETQKEVNIYYHRVLGLKIFSIVKKLPQQRQDFFREKTNQIYQTYLAQYQLTEEQFPKPYVDIVSGFHSASFSRHVRGKVMQTNLITLGQDEIKDDPDMLVAVLAHEMAHYFHRHGSIQSKYLKANQETNLELTQENNYGEGIVNDAKLQTQLNYLDKMHYYLEPKSSNYLADLPKIRITPKSVPDQILNFLTDYEFSTQAYTVDQKICRSEVKTILHNIRKASSFTYNDIQELSYTLKRCELYRIGSTQEIFSHFYAKENYKHLFENTKQKAQDPEHANYLTAKSIINKDHPLTVMLTHFYSQRKAVKKALEQIQFDKLIFFSKENQADITSFGILESLNLEYTILKTHQFHSQADESCEELSQEFSISQQRKNSFYYGDSFFNSHNAQCWRYYRAKTMQEKK